MFDESLSSTNIIEEHCPDDGPKIIVTTCKQAFVAAARNGHPVILRRSPEEIARLRQPMRKAWNQCKNPNTQLDYEAFYVRKHEGLWQEYQTPHAIKPFREEFDTLVSLFRKVHPRLDVYAADILPNFVHRATWHQHPFPVVNSVWLSGGTMLPLSEIKMKVRPGQLPAGFAENIVQAQEGDIVYIPRDQMHVNDEPNPNGRLTLAVR